MSKALERKLKKLEMNSNHKFYAIKESENVILVPSKFVRLTKGEFELWKASVGTEVTLFDKDWNSQFQKELNSRIDQIIKLSED